MADPEKCKQFGAAGRKRVEEKFGWPAIAKQTAELYRSLTKK
jgi:starch synthase